MVQLEKGTRIYYTGDMANNEDFGTIVKVENHSRWGVSVDIKLDDGRDIRRLSPLAFSPEYLGHGGTRFVTVAAYNAYRRAQFPECKVYQYPEKAV